MVSTTDTTPSIEQQLIRLRAVVAYLATAMCASRDDPLTPRMSEEEVVERLLYPEHFMTAATGEERTDRL